MSDRDTICALATPPGRGAIAVVRISGPRAHTVLAAVGGAAPADRTMRLRKFRTADGEVIDEGLAVAFPVGGGPTSEPYAELHLHGGVAVVAAALRALTDAGARIAQPGEFSRRALAAGRMDLTQIEGLADLIDAETEAQRRQAARAMQGALRDQAAVWRAALVGARALLEATIDFADEDEIPDEAVAQARTEIADLIGALDAALSGFSAAAVTREGLEVALIGPPNAGKSSLLNAIAGREVALTSALAGTTRDAIEVRCVIAGQLVTLVDTAGQRETDDPLERAGVSWARRRAATADLRLVVRAPDALDAPAHEADDILVWNKADLGVPDPLNGVAVSAHTGQGLADLLDEVAAGLRPRTAEAGVVTRERHRAAVSRARDLAARALDSPAEIAAEELRAAAAALDALVGRVDVDDVLDEIFSRFCLGK